MKPRGDLAKSQRHAATRIPNQADGSDCTCIGDDAPDAGEVVPAPSAALLVEDPGGPLGLAGVLGGRPEIVAAGGAVVAVNVDAVVELDQVEGRGRDSRGRGGEEYSGGTQDAAQDKQQMV